MTLSERIEQFRRREHGNMMREDAYAASEVNGVVDDVLDMAQETDELMAEMADSINELQAWITDGGYEDTAEGVAGICGEARRVIHKYKEQTND